MEQSKGRADDEQLFVCLIITWASRGYAYL
jgi:hypothetical protein